MQLHIRFASSAAEDKDGFVWISRDLMAESRSESAVEAPCMAVPPVMLTLVFGAGEAVRELCADADLCGDSESETSDPAADGGNLEVMGLLVAEASSVIRGICVASGALCRRAKLSATISLWALVAREAVVDM